MSTKGVADSKKLEDDLTREVEQDLQDASYGQEEEQERSGNVEAIRNLRRSSELSQLESTNQKKKTTRTRPKVVELKSKSKRRKTSESEHSDLSENPASATIEDEPVAGPSSALSQRTKESHDRTLFPDHEIREDEKNEDNDEEMEAETSDEIHPGESSTVDPGGYEDSTHGPSHAPEMYQQIVEEDAPTSSSYREMFPDEQSENKPSTSNAHRQRFTPPSARSAVLEEIFRMPIYEAESRRSVFDPDRHFNEEDNVVYHDDEIAGPSRPVVMGRSSEGGITEGTEGQREVEILLQEKQRMVWARKIFFRSTDLIFPGFARYADAQSMRKECMAVRVRSSWPLQALLYADLLFFIMWFLAFLSTFDIAVTVLKELHGNLVLCMTALFTLVNIPRLLFGLKGNENDKMELLALFWMMTFIVQVPLFGFILFTDVFTPVRLAFTLTMDAVMMTFILLEVIVGTIHLKNLIRDELKVIELAKKSEHLLKARQEDSNLRPRVINTADGPVVDWVDQNDEIEDELHGRRRSAAEDDDDWSTDESVEEFSRRALGRDPAVDYRLKIRRLRMEELEEPERDDSNQVSSTSDSIRQRQVRVI